MNEPFVHPYIPNSAPATKAAMLAAVNAESVEDFFAEIPDHLRVKGLLDLPPALLAEEDLKRHVNGLLAKNNPNRLKFLGRGTYFHTTAAVMWEVIGRGEFLTAYAGEPYEDHGRFQALFEYESLMGELLACDVVTVPTYDGFQATATALAMAYRINGRSRVLAVNEILADKFVRVHDYVRANLTIETLPTHNGLVDLAKVKAALGEDVAAIWVESPSAIGVIETQIRELADLAHAAGALLIVGTDPLMYGIVEPPSVQGADITCGDIQSLGLGQWFGGAHGGFLAMADDPTLVMQLPSRLFGIASTDVPGEYGFGDVAYDRTSFAHREEGNEWVGTAAALWGIGAGVFLSLLGPAGMRELGETIMLRMNYVQKKLSDMPGFELTDSAPHFREFVVRTTESVDSIIARGRAAGVEPGVKIDDHHLCICVTEQNRLEDIERLLSVLASKEVAA